jgi:AmiR/NasT family two-component response regulator
MALQRRDLIGQAKGLLMATHRCNSDEAFALLVDESQRTNRKLVEVAGEVTRRGGEVRLTARRRPRAGMSEEQRG